MDIDAVWLWKLPLYGLLVDGGLYVLFSVLHMVSWFFHSKTLEGAFYVWAELHYPLCLYFEKYYHDDFLGTNLMLVFANTALICLVIGLATDLIKAYKK